LLDALALGEMPSFGESLAQIKAADEFLDRLVLATVAAG
jgi:hypothetical protein